MSYILDALKRSDLHRELLSEPAPAPDEHARVLHLRSPDVSRLAPVLMAFAAVGAAAILTLHSREDLPLPAAQAPAPAALAPAAPTEKPAAPQPSPPAKHSAQAAAQAQPEHAAPAPAAPPVETTAQTDGQAAAAPPPADKPSAAEGPAPLFADLPLAYRQSVPFLHVDVHAWSAFPGKRFVMLNGHIYREGDATREGPVVERIEPHGVVLSYRGRSYKLLR